MKLKIATDCEDKILVNSFVMLVKMLVKMAKIILVKGPIGIPDTCTRQKYTAFTINYLYLGLADLFKGCKLLMSCENLSWTPYKV